MRSTHYRYSCSVIPTRLIVLVLSLVGIFSSLWGPGSNWLLFAQTTSYFGNALNLFNSHTNVVVTRGQHIATFLISVVGLIGAVDSEPWLVRLYFYTEMLQMLANALTGVLFYGMVLFQDCAELSGTDSSSTSGDGASTYASCEDARKRLLISAALSFAISTFVHIWCLRAINDFENQLRDENVENDAKSN